MGDAKAKAQQTAADKSVRQEAALKAGDKKPGTAHARPKKVLSHGKSTAASPIPTKSASNNSGSRKPEKQSLAQEPQPARKPHGQAMHELGSPNDDHAQKAGPQQGHKPDSKTDSNQPATHARN